MEITKLENKLVRAISKAGLTWSSVAGIIQISDNIEGIQLDPQKMPAAWFYHHETKKELIAIHPQIIEDFSVEEIMLIIKHELLHKAFYRGINGLQDLYLLNISLDACINKILWIAHYKTMDNLCNKLYLGENRISPLAICNPSTTILEKKLLPKNIKEIFEEIYPCDDPKRAQNIPDPLNLYYKLSVSLSSEQKEEATKDLKNLTDQSSKENNDSKEKNEENGGNEKNNNNTENQEKKQENNQKEEKPKEENKKEEVKKKSKKPVSIRGCGDKVSKNINKDTQNVEKQLAKNLRDGLPYYSRKEMGAVFEKFIFKSENFETNELKDFIKSLQTLRQVEGIEQNIYSRIASNLRFDPYIEDLTRTGLEYVVLGISGPEGMPFYLNKSDKTTCKNRICVYLDVSPSMYVVMPYMVHFVDFFAGLEECELSGGEYAGKYTFAGSVEGLSDQQWEDFRKGQMNMGYTTSFDAVIKHCLKHINENEVDIILIITDGYSNLVPELVKKFNETTKQCYRVYFTFNGLEMKSDLDTLNGASFCIKVPA